MPTWFRIEGHARSPIRTFPRVSMKRALNRGEQFREPLPTHSQELRRLAPLRGKILTGRSPHEIVECASFTRATGEFEIGCPTPRSGGRKLPAQPTCSVHQRSARMMAAASAIQSHMDGCVPGSKCLRSGTEIMRPPPGLAAIASEPNFSIAYGTTFPPDVPVPSGIPGLLSNRFSETMRPSKFRLSFTT